MSPHETLDDPGPVTLEVTSLAAGGRGVGRHDGRVWFVDGGLPGDLVVAQPARVRRSFVEATAVEVVRASGLRREPPCAHQAKCGGCPWMPLTESEQRRFKTGLVADALARIGGLAEVVAEPIRTPVSPLAYRNRVELATDREKDRVVLGLHGRGPSSGVVDVDRCEIQSEAANRLLTTIRTRLAADEHRESTAVAVERVTIRRSETSGGLVVGLGTQDRPQASLDVLARELMDAHPEVQGVVQLRQLPGRRGGIRARVLAGEGRVRERVAGFHFDLHPTSFFQVNSRAAEAVLELVREMASAVEGKQVLDLYGGVGLYALGLVQAGAKAAVVCDADVEAVRCGRETAARQAPRKIRYVHGDVRRFLAGGDGGRPDVVVMNPPRTGLGKGVANLVRELGAERLILVSCDPPTLARDLAALTGGGLYRIERLVPLDLFPQTAHVEAVASLVRSA